MASAAQVPEEVLVWLHNSLSRVCECPHSPLRLQALMRRCRNTMIYHEHTQTSRGPYLHIEHCPLERKFTVRDKHHPLLQSLLEQGTHIRHPSFRTWHVGATAPPPRHSTCVLQRDYLSISDSIMDTTYLPSRESHCLRNAVEGLVGEAWTACKRRGQDIPPILGGLDGELGGK